MAVAKYDAKPVVLIDPSGNAYAATGAASSGTGDVNLKTVDPAVVLPVSVGNFPATQAVSLASVPTHAVTQSGAFTVGQTGTWNVTTTPSNGATATVTAPATSTTSATLTAANTARKTVIIYNGATVNLLVKFGATASATSFTTQILPGGTLSVPRETYTGIIDAILASGAASTSQVTVVV